jgi:Fic family protein
MDPLEIIPVSLLVQYSEKVDDLSLRQAFNQLHDAELSTGTFSFYTSVASVFSSKIEGEDIELDSYIKYKRDSIQFLPDYTQKIDDLYSAYLFAQCHALNEQNIAEAHRTLSRHIVTKHYRGTIRTQNMYVSTPDGKIEYVAATPYEVKAEMQKLYADIATLLRKQLTITEVFFFAAMIHLVFVKIHPFNDDNGRTVRLLEKWFLAQKLGEKGWFIQSEKGYYKLHTKTCAC